MLQLLLRCQVPIYQVRVEAAEAEDEDAEEHSDERSNQTDPVL